MSHILKETRTEEEKEKSLQVVPKTDWKTWEAFWQSVSHNQKSESEEK